MVNRKNHALFEMHPLSGSVSLSTGEVSAPYHIYDGHMLLIGGTADGDAIRGLLSREQVAPITTANGRALVAIWVADFADANHGPHMEYQFSVLVAPDAIQLDSNHPFAALKALVSTPEAGLLCHGIWNNTSEVVSYNSEHLALPACLSISQITRGGGRMRFSFTDAESGSELLSGQVSEASRQPIGAGWQLMRALGFGTATRVNAQPWIEADVINPIGEMWASNRRAKTFTAPDALILQHFDLALDSMTLGDPYADIGFEPQLLEHMRGVRFVYLSPDEAR